MSVAISSRWSCSELTGNPVVYRCGQFAKPFAAFAAWCCGNVSIGS